MPIHADQKKVLAGGDAAAGHIPAGRLCNDHLGQLVEFYWNYPNGVLAHIAGRLEKIVHTTAWVHISLSGYPTTALSGPGRSGEFEEYNLEHDAPIEVEL